MPKKQPSVEKQQREDESNEELVGVLTAISVVSKRLAKKLTLLEQRSNAKEGERSNGKNPVMPGDAN